MDSEIPKSPWLSEIDDVLKSSESLGRVLFALSEWLWRNVVPDDVFPRELPGEVAALLASLAREIDVVRGMAVEAKDRYRERPLALLAAGYELSDEQYHVRAATGRPIFSSKQVGIADHDDYDVYRMFCYEDDDVRTYINPGWAPRRDGDKIKMRFGRPPEELQRSFLRPEQVAFFSDYLPDLLARFRFAADVEAE